jgi:hypothetical protein
VGRAERRRPIGGPRRAWMDNIKIELIMTKSAYEVIDLVQETVEESSESNIEHLRSIKYLKILRNWLFLKKSSTPSS